MKTNQTGIDLIKSFEGLRLKAYRDPVGVWTIGWGHTHFIYAGQQCNENQAETWLKADIYMAEKAINRLVRVPLNANQFSALVSFVFNVGSGNFSSSTLLRLLNLGKYATVPGQLKRWVYGTVAGKKTMLPGLMWRREAEAKLWNKEEEEDD